MWLLEIDTYCVVFITLLLNSTGLRLQVGSVSRCFLHHVPLSLLFIQPFILILALF